MKCSVSPGRDAVTRTIHNNAATKIQKKTLNKAFLVTQTQLNLNSNSTPTQLLLNSSS